VERTTELVVREVKFPRGYSEVRTLALSGFGYLESIPSHSTDLHSTDGKAEVRYQVTSKGQAAWEAYRFTSWSGVLVVFIIEFFRIRNTDNAHAILDRVEHDTPDLEDAKVRAQSLFGTLDMPQKPDALRILDHTGDEVFYWSPQGSRG